MPLATRRDIGQFLIGSMPGTTIPVELRSLAREFDLGGVILFGRNIETPEQVAELSAECEAPTRTGYVNHLLVSSEPLQGENHWTALAEGGIVAVDAFMRLHRVDA